MKRTGRTKPKPVQSAPSPAPTAPEQPTVLSAREYVKLYGIWSDDLPRPGRRSRPPYSIT
jgi:hypothetical protein